MRPVVNAGVLCGGLLVALPTIVIAERIRRGAGARIARATIRILSLACGIRYEHLGDAGVERAVYVPNHSSPADIPALLLALPDARFVAAAELFDVPLLGAAMRALGAMPVDRTRRLDAQRHLAEGIAPDSAVVIFAEGGIPAPGEARRFTTGAFSLAISRGSPVVPVTIGGSADVLPRGKKVFVRPGVITVEFHAPIETTGLTLRDRKALRDETERVVRGAAIRS